MDDRIRRLEAAYAAEPTEQNHLRLQRARMQAHPIDFRDLLQSTRETQGEGTFALARNRRVAFGEDGPQLSLQASSTHYSEPRRTLEDLHEYIAWEVAYFDEGDEFDTPPEGAPLDDAFEHDQVAGYVETEEAQALFDYLRLHFGEPHIPDPE